MIYEWQCKKCGYTVEVNRKLADYNVPPNAEEGRHALDPMGYVHDVKWERVIGVASVPFEHLRNSGVFANDNGDYAPWSRNM